MDFKYFAQVIRFHRKKSGLSRLACAQLAGVGKTAIYDIEQGKETVQMDTFFKVLQVLNIQIQLSSPLMPLFEKTIP
jgi:HTH-type transcriptional regulator/antitoxin HipB